MMFLARITIQLPSLFLMAALALGLAASASAQLVTFDTPDLPPGGSARLSYQSTENPNITFSSIPAIVFIGTIDGVSATGNVLCDFIGHGVDFPSSLLLSFASPVRQLIFDAGNDDPNRDAVAPGSNNVLPGDIARVVVTNTTVPNQTQTFDFVLNGNRLTDQRFALTTTFAFNSAIITYFAGSTRPGVVAGQPLVISECIDNVFAAAVPEVTPPTCQIIFAGVVNGRFVIRVRFQDPTGLLSISVDRAVNITPVIPVFPPGTTGEVIVEATIINPALAATLVLRGTDVAGNVVICDPVVVTLDPRGTGKPVANGPHAILPIDHKVLVTNGTPGLTSLSLDVNGKIFQVAGLKDGGTRSVDIRSALKPSGNTLTIIAYGKPGGSATVMAHD